jgi:hypothetical protein
MSNIMHKEYMVKVLEIMDDMIYDNHFVARKNSTILREKFRIFQSLVKKQYFVILGYAEDMKYCKH